MPASPCKSAVQEVHHVAVLHHIGLALGAQLARFARLRLASERDIIVVGDRFGADEAFLEIAVDFAGGFGRGGAGVDGPRARFLRAPLVIGVISSARELHKIPVWEQELSAGAVCQNILIAATALGFVGNWLTEWYAYHPLVKEKIGLKPGERVAGFIYIGHAKDPLEERPRPAMDAIVTTF